MLRTTGGRRFRALMFSVGASLLTMQVMSEEWSFLETGLKRNRHIAVKVVATAWRGVFDRMFSLRYGYDPGDPQLAKQRHLRRAPIVEAVVDFRVRLSGPLTADDLVKKLQGEQFGYVQKGAVIRGGFGFAITVSDQPSVKPVPGDTVVIGSRWHSADEKYVAQFTIEGFALSRLSPYESWENLIQEAGRVWAVYLRCAAPSQIVRVATRYINNLGLPLAQGELYEKFIVRFLEVPDPLPQVVSGFLQRFVLGVPEEKAKVILTLAMAESRPIANVPIILDIDAFHEHEYSADDNGAWDCLNKLRDLKNRCFFGSLTEAAMELYE